MSAELDAKNGQEGQNQVERQYPKGMHPRLRYLKPYWWPYRTFVKQRWIGRQLLEVISTEFRDRSVDYYRHALECGVTKVNGVIAYPELILRNSDRIDNTVHRHEPPVTNDPVLVLHIDKEKEFIVVSKPGSMPVHAAGRYFKHTLLELLKTDYGIHGYAANRLDRLTSGLMILSLSGKASARLAKEFASGKVKKEYIARVRGKFPDGDIVVDEPLLSVDRQMGLVIVAPQGKEAKTIFTRMSYDAKRDQSVVHCKPQTGRTHQLRVHLQYLGYPIANDPLYSQEEIWGPGCGKGGVDLVDQQEGESSQMAAIRERVVRGDVGMRQRTGKTPPPPVPDDSARLEGKEEGPEVGSTVPRKEDREFDNIDVSSPIRLSDQARQVIAGLRRQRDEADDWGKWKEVVWATKAAQDELEKAENGGSGSTTETESSKKKERAKIPHPRVNAKIKRSKAVEREMLEDTPSPMVPPINIPEGFCDQCFTPLPDDPDPETLFIYLHALRYTTEELGTWETPLPKWADENWDGDWRGWVGGPPANAVPMLPEAKARLEAQTRQAEEEEAERLKAGEANQVELNETERGHPVEGEADQESEGTRVAQPA